MKRTDNIFSVYLPLVWNLFLSFLVFFLCRVVFVICNRDLFAESLDYMMLFRGGVMFDIAAMVYFNALFIALLIFPMHLKEYSKAYQNVPKVAFIVCNTIAMLANLSDTVYFRFTGRRSTPTVFQEFQNEDNIFSIVLKECLNSWYLVLFAVAVIFLMHKLYMKPLLLERLKDGKGIAKYYITRILLLSLTAYICVLSVRGGTDRTTRPISIANANKYVNHPIENAIVLNTPFSVLRTIGKKVFVNPDYFPSMEEVEKIYSPLRHNILPDSLRHKGKNVVVMILESMGPEYTGAYNKDIWNGEYKGYTPFLDSLIENCALTFDYAVGNGRKSIDGTPSVLASIPYMIEPFFLTPAAVNNFSGIGEELAKDGYETAFFHGAPNGSMGFEAFVKAAGFEKYYGMTEYCEDERFGGEADFDGYWAIWDEEFLQYYALKMSEMKEPFCTSIFTATSHHPFQIPERYKAVYPEGAVPILKCAQYVDNALRNFFNTAKQQPWFENTLFVLINDHSNQTVFEKYNTDMGKYAANLIFYAPGDTEMRGKRRGAAQQIDIMPTVLDYVGYERPYVAFGFDVLATDADERFCVNYSNGVYQFYKYGYFMQFDGENVRSVYRMEDMEMQRDVRGEVGADTLAMMEREAKAFVQDYMVRMIEDRLQVE